MKRLLGNTAMCVMILFFFDSSATAFKLPSTGQTSCYDTTGNVFPCSGTGQDGEYPINPLAYTNNGDGTVTDNNTGLMWQKCSTGQNNDSSCSGTASTWTWYQATGTYDADYNPSSQDVCRSLSLDGYMDWRLPTKKELMSIVDYSGFPTTIKTAYFPNTINNWYWSSTAYPYLQGWAWGISFNTGAGVGYGAGAGSSYYVRCVRGQQTSQSLTNNGDGTVTDNKTGLMWQQGESDKMSWYDALSYCQGRPLAGQNDWRLPNIKELESLTDDTRYNPSIDNTFFPEAHADYYWSSTTSTIIHSDAFYVVFANGPGVAYYPKSYNYYARCVRGGQGGSLDNFVRLVREGIPVDSYAKVQDAYNDASSGDIIEMRGMTMIYIEQLSFAANIAVSLKGGYNYDFVLNPLVTTVNGALTVSGGSVTVDSLNIQ